MTFPWCVELDVQLSDVLWCHKMDTRWNMGVIWTSCKYIEIQSLIDQSASGNKAMGAAFPMQGCVCLFNTASSFEINCNTVLRFFLYVLLFKCHPSTLDMFQHCCRSDLQWLRDVTMVCSPLVVKIVRISHMFCFVDWQWCWLLQVMLCNPICVLGYTIASWRFFRERIEEEELSLIHFFAEDYVEYKKKVPTGLPFISGIRVN